MLAASGLMPSGGTIPWPYVFRPPLAEPLPHRYLLLHDLDTLARPHHGHLRLDEPGAAGNRLRCFALVVRQQPAFLSIQSTTRDRASWPEGEKWLVSAMSPFSSATHETEQRGLDPIGVGQRGASR